VLNAIEFFALRPVYRVGVRYGNSAGPQFRCTQLRLWNQSDQPCARSQSLIKPWCKKPSRNACLPQITRQNQFLGE
jgi:hypothetical protein